MTRLRHLVAAFALTIAPIVGVAQVSTESPFSAAGGAESAASAPSQAGDYEFVGVMRLGQKAVFGFSKRDGRSIWVEEGAEKEGVAVLSRPDPQRVTVRIGGTVTELRLKNPSDAPATPSGTAAGNPLPLPPPPPPQNKAEQAAQEREARMLVSDLLEIGMQQRKAYEEAQKRKGATTQPPTPPGAPGASGTPVEAQQRR